MIPALGRHAVVAILSIGLGAAGAAAEPAKAQFGAQRVPSAGAPMVIGAAARGCLAGAVALAPEGPGWQVLRPQRNRFWGHPETLAFVARLAETGQALGWPAILVGDISQPRGGPMTFGHASHQSGIDVDIWLRRPDRRLSAAELADPLPQTMVAPDGRRVAAGWTPSHAALIEAAARDPAVDRIFVNAAIKAELCRSAPASDRAWLRRIRPWWGHANHFHVRLACPADQPACEAQTPLPPGDGCDATLDWWFSDEALNPPPRPPAPPRPDLTLADLPDACRAVLVAP